MSHRRYMTTIGGTILSVLGIVWLTQAGRAPAAAFAPQPAYVQQAVPSPAMDGALREDRTADLGDLMRGDALPGLRPPAPLPAPEAAGRGARHAQGCAISASATPGEMATVRLRVEAPCLAGERLTVHHAGMMFSDRTDAAGLFAAEIPALAERAVFIIAFDDGSGAVATARVAGLDRIERAVLQWRGRAGFELHAREFGADYGAPGHLWFGADGAGAVGRMVRLGDPDLFSPRLADIYSFPADRVRRAGAVALSVETEVTAENCGREVAAETMRLKDGRLQDPRDLTLTMPDCDAVGSFLVLNNLVDDLKIAAK